MRRQPRNPLVAVEPQGNARDRAGLLQGFGRHLQPSPTALRHPPTPATIRLSRLGIMAIGSPLTLKLPDDVSQQAAGRHRSCRRSPKGKPPRLTAGR